MNQWIRRAVIAVLGVAALGAAALATGAMLGERKSQRQIAIDPKPLAVEADAAGIDRGRYLFLSRGCTECHGTNGAGKTFIEDGNGMLVHAPNITPSPSGVVAAYKTEDWVRIIRHGVKPDRRPAQVMPSEDYNRLTDADLAALIAYLRQMPAADGRPATVQYPMLVKALYGFGVLRDAAEKIDHALPPSQPIPEGVSAAHGAYVANACIGCHGASLSGGKIPGAPPDWPAAANLTPGQGSAMTRYPDAQAFATMLRTGKRPDGTEVSSVMPFVALKEMNSVDVEAVYLHLKSLPARATGEAR